ncbi:MAG: hypothetical protein D6719_01140 [Candidatus Dadabacteria bacterium]|nr:MAG: hypothetical protein D6719_01140 [Candidatus Dadabacteria bacterium]
MATFLIVFREALEVSLTLVLVIAATKGLAGRNKWLWLGIGAGLFGSVVVARSTEAISSAMAGMGQELFNATVLAVSGVLIASTVVWMKTHGARMARQIKETGKAVLEGRKPAVMLAAVIALTVLRDGAEVVLLSQGFFALGTNTVQLLAGGLAGLFAGAALGYLMYLGIVVISPRVMFSVLGVLLSLVAAGMMAQAVGYLAAADIVTVFNTPLWDTSHIVSENGWFGEILHILVGYTSRPSLLQLLAYGLTLACIYYTLIILKLNAKAQAIRAALAVVLAAGILAVFVNRAYAIDKIYSPVVHEGETEVEWRGKYQADPSGDMKNKLEVGKAWTDRFSNSLILEVNKQEGEEFKATELALENVYQLFEQGKYWLDAGLYFEIGADLTGNDSHKLEGKLLLEKGGTDYLSRANIIVERKVGGGASDETEGEFAFSLRSRLGQHFEPGFEWFSEIEDLKKWGSFDEQEHFIGPAVYGRYGFFWYELAYLFGVSDEAPDGVLRWTFEYEWY